MRWAFPDFGWWLIGLPVVLIILALVYGRTFHAIRNWFRKEEYALHVPGLKFVLRGIGLSCIAIAIVGPYWGRREQKVNVMGREVYILLDVSASMNAEDLKPSRLEKLKQDMKRMVNDLRGDKIGLIVFTSHAYVQTPLTNDVSMLMTYIDLVKTDQFANTGTDFRQALMKARDRFKNVDVAKSKVSRAIILISDGENFGEGYASVTDALNKDGIKVFPVGVGTPEGAPVPQMVYGKQNGFLKNPDGSTAISKLTDESLKEMAEEFGTEYYAIDNQVKDLRPVTEQIKLQSATLVDTKTEQVNNNRYQFFLLPGLIMMALTLFLLPLRRNKV